uniref:Prephenate dehydrogenase n=1 Tax=Paulinella chromatophora TaxID=39717 RepID=B1X514_PAUCH|nr:prephenate dehydrogenase [Paulinella chromatophora]ACB43033.1 prephenate dehydrogenase [Paulinella chromatophora]
MTDSSGAPLGIVGLGLIGGSLGLDLQSLGYTVHGIVSKEQRVKRARERGLATVVSVDLELLSECELIILAIPLEKLLTPSNELIEALPVSAIITDVGSVKSPVLEKWQKLHPRFVASHPMTGTAYSGLEAGLEGLFAGRPWVATPNSETDFKALDKVRKLAESVGSNWLISKANVHDQAVALISHMPVFASAGLLSTVSKEMYSPLGFLAQALASSGFADTTRIGAGTPHIGTSMVKNNTESILRAIKLYLHNMENFESLIIDENWEKIYNELKQCQELRPEFL